MSVRFEAHNFEEIAQAIDAAAEAYMEKTKSEPFIYQDYHKGVYFGLRQAAKILRETIIAGSTGGIPSVSNILDG